MFEADWGDSIAAAVHELTDALDEETREGVGDCETIIAESAQLQHTYTNRTGTLEAMTLPGEISGSMSNGDLRGEVVALTPYGEYVEHKNDGRFKFLAPANDRTQAQQSRSLDERLRKAVRRSGRWK